MRASTNQDAACLTEEPSDWPLALIVYKLATHQTPTKGASQQKQKEDAVGVNSGAGGPGAAFCIHTPDKQQPVCSTRRWLIMVYLINLRGGEGGVRA